jgi:cytochrome c oxidase assembly protein subunit 15
MNRMQTTTFYRMAWAALALTFVVVILGAYVRLSDAGLGCPDWPGCYGRLLDIPDQADQIAEPIPPIRTDPLNPPRHGRK